MRPRRDYCVSTRRDKWIWNISRVRDTITLDTVQKIGKQRAEWFTGGQLFAMQTFLSLMWRWFENSSMRVRVSRAISRNIRALCTFYSSRKDAYLRVVISWNIIQAPKKLVITSRNISPPEWRRRSCRTQVSR